MRNHKRTMSVFYATHGKGPWECFFCNLTVLSIGQNTWDGNVHHIDGDETNDVPSNVVMTHVVCHQRHHYPTDDQKKKISETLKGRPSPTKGMTFSPEVNARKARHGADNHQYGKPLPQHTRDAISEANRRKVACDRCGVEISQRWIKRHQQAGCKPLKCTKISGEARVVGKLPKLICSECNKPYAAGWMKRHKNGGKCVDQERTS